MLLLCGAVSLNLPSASSIEIYYIITERELQKKTALLWFFPVRSNCSSGCGLCSDFFTHGLVPQNAVSVPDQ